MINAWAEQKVSETDQETFQKFPGTVICLIAGFAALQQMQ